MARDALLRSSLLFVGAVVVLVGLCTYSFKKMVGTYVFGLLAVAGVVLPDWEFFDRDFSQWFSPVPATAARAESAPEGSSRSERFKIYPLRVASFITIYSFGLYKWWIFVSR